MRSPARAACIVQCQQLPSCLQLAGVALHLALLETIVLSHDASVSAPRVYNRHSGTGLRYIPALHTWAMLLLNMLMQCVGLIAFVMRPFPSVQFACLLPSVSSCALVQLRGECSAADGIKNSVAHLCVCGAGGWDKMVFTDTLHVSKHLERCVAV